MTSEIYESILICTAIMNTSEEPRAQILDELQSSAPIFCNNSNSLGITTFTKYNYVNFIEQLILTRDLLKKNKIKFRPIITGVLSASDKDSIQVQIKITDKQVKIIPGTLKIIFNKNINKEKKKLLTLEEKIALVKEWHAQNPGEIPDSKVIYKEFKLGKFCEKANKDAELKQHIDTILTE